MLCYVYRWTVHTYTVYSGHTCTLMVRLNPLCSSCSSAFPFLSSLATALASLVRVVQYLHTDRLLVKAVKGSLAPQVREPVVEVVLQTLVCSGGRVLASSTAFACWALLAVACSTNLAADFKPLAMPPVHTWKGMCQICSYRH